MQIIYNVCFWFVSQERSGVIITDCHNIINIAYPISVVLYLTVSTIITSINNKFVLYFKKCLLFKYNGSYFLIHFELWWNPSSTHYVVIPSNFFVLFHQVTLNIFCFSVVRKSYMADFSYGFWYGNPVNNLVNKRRKAFKL